MEYCCHVWADAPSCYLELLDKLQKQICRTVGPSLAFSLEPLAHCRHPLAHKSFLCSQLKYLKSFLGITLVNVHLNCPLSYSQCRSSRYSDRLPDFSVTIPRC